MFKLRLPSPAIVIACLALLVASSGTAIAASPVVKRALFANNAGKLQGKSAAEIAGLPGPASSAAGLVSIKVAPWSLGPGQGTDLFVGCDAGKKAVSGGYEDPNGWAHSWDSRPSADGGGWRTYINVPPNATGAQSGSIYAVCLG
jgi:hypothetical protein